MEKQILPQWTARAFRFIKGRDHLGLGAVSSGGILESLAHGINVLTIHPRYHSFYTFVLDEFWRRELPRSRREFVKFYRPCEYVFSLGVYFCDLEEHGKLSNVVGWERVIPQGNLDLELYEQNFDYIKSELGGYGLYYRAVISNIGLIYQGGTGSPFPIDVPTERGKEVAGLFRKAIEETEYYREYFGKADKEVPRGVITEYGRKACLCQLKKDDAPDKKALIDLYLHGGNNPEPRRHTFRFFIDLAEQTSGHPINQDSFRQLVYFSSSSTGAQYKPRSSTEDTYQRWRLYQAREYYVFAINSMWKYICNYGVSEGGELHPIPIEQVVGHIQTSLDFGKLAKDLGVKANGLTKDSDASEMLEWLCKIMSCSKEGFDSACTLESPINEDALYRATTKKPYDARFAVSGMVLMLGLVYLRFGDPDLQMRKEWDIAYMGGYNRLSLDGYIRSMHKRLKAPGFSVMDFVKWICEEYIIKQHIITALGKLPDNTFRFQIEGSSLRFFSHENEVNMTDSRFFAISTSLLELGFCTNFADPDHELTGIGRVFLDKGDLP